MEQSRIISTAMNIYHVTKLNTYFLQENGDLMYHHESISIPDFMPGANGEHVFHLQQLMDKENQIYSYVNEWGLRYFGYSFTKSDEKYSLIVGPYFEIPPNIYYFSIEYQLNSKQSEDLRIVSEKISVLTVEHANSIANVLQQFKSMIESEVVPTVIVSDKKKDKVNKRIDSFTEDEEAELIKLRYKVEKEFMHAVEQGDNKRALQQISSDNQLFSFSERFPSQPMRRLKNLTIVLNTLLRIAARNADVPAILIHRTSEMYAFEIENASNLTTLTKLYDQMIEKYCDLVKEYDLSNYSPMIQRVIEHLVSFYDKQLNKENIAKMCQTHPSNLSRKFKQETNMTIVSYQQMLRMNQAKHLLKTESLSIEEIAWIVGYEDPSYFARVFKQEAGVTPSQYREG